MEVNNIGTKIKFMVKGIVILGLFAFFICFMNGLSASGSGHYGQSQAGKNTMLYSAIGALALCISAMPMYGFGVLVENSEYSAKIARTLDEKLTNIENQLSELRSIAPHNSVPLSSHVMEFSSLNQSSNAMSSRALVNTEKQPSKSDSIPVSNDTETGGSAVQHFRRFSNYYPAATYVNQTTVDTPVEPSPNFEEPLLKILNHALQFSTDAGLMAQLMHEHNTVKDPNIKAIIKNILETPNASLRETVKEYVKTHS